MFLFQSFCEFSQMFVDCRSIVTKQIRCSSNSVLSNDTSPSGHFFFLIYKTQPVQCIKWLIIIEVSKPSLFLVYFPPPPSKNFISLQWKQAFFLLEGAAFQVRQIKCWVLHNLIIKDSCHLPPVRVCPLETVFCTYVNYILSVEHS